MLLRQDLQHGPVLPSFFCSLKVSSMSDHIAVGEVTNNHIKSLLRDSTNKEIGNLSALISGFGSWWQPLARYQFAVLTGQSGAATAKEKVTGIFFGFCDPKLCQACL